VQPNAVTRLIAQRIIESAREGVSDPAILEIQAVRGFRPGLRH
jgi:hypothetical protein